MRCKPRELMSYPLFWKVCPWGNSFLATAFSLSFFRSQLVLRRGEGNSTAEALLVRPLGVTVRGPVLLSLSWLLLKFRGLLSKGRAFLHFYLTSALRCLTHTPPWSAYSADPQPDNSCRVQYGGQAGPGDGCLRTCSLALPLLCPLPLAWPWRLWTASPAGLPRPSDRSCLELSLQGQQATTLQLRLEQQDGSLSGKKSCFLFTWPACV